MTTTFEHAPAMEAALKESAAATKPLEDGGEDAADDDAAADDDEGDAAAADAEQQPPVLPKVAPRVPAFSLPGVRLLGALSATAVATAV